MGKSLFREEVLGAAAILCAAVFGVLAWCASAGAMVIHVYESPSLHGFSRPIGVAVTAGSGGLVFVADENGGFVERFVEGSREPSSFAAHESYVEGAKLTGTPGGPFGVYGVTGVAVDEATGEIFVAAGGGVDVFSGAGEYLGSLTETPVSAEVSGPFRPVGGLAFDQKTGELYIADLGVVDVFKRTGPGAATFVTQFGNGTLEPVREETVAVVESGPEEGTVFVGEPHHELVDVFQGVGSSVTVVEWGGGATPSGSFGTVAVHVGLDEASRHVLVADAGHDVVDELNAVAAVEEYLGRLKGVSASEGFTDPLAVSAFVSGAHVLVGDYDEGDGVGVVDVFGPDLDVPGVEPLAASAVGSVSAVLHGRVLLEGGGPASCVFAWGTTPALGHTTACVPAEVTGEEEAVEARLEGLAPDTKYYFVVQATNAHGENAGEASPPLEFLTTGPGVESETVSDVSATSATLNASVNPNDAATSVFFEYGTGTGYGERVPVSAGVSLGAGGSAVAVSEHVQEGLAAGTLYHFRLTAVSVLEGKEEVFHGPDETFRTQTSGGFKLIDGRGWEMVSPPHKEGALIEAPGEPGIFQAAAGGQAMAYLANVPTEAGVVGYSNLQQVLSTRAAAGGWSSADLSAGHNGGVGGSDNAGQEYRYFSEDLSAGIVQPFGAFLPCEIGGRPQPCLSADATEQTAFVHSDYVGGNLSEPCPTAAEVAAHVSCFTPLVTGKPGVANVPEGTVFGQRGSIFGEPCPPEKFCGPFFEGASPDAEHVILRAAGVQLTGTPAPDGGLYEWNAGAPPAQQLQLVSILPRNGKGEELAATEGLLSTSENENARGAVSSDGSRVFWMSNTLQLYLRDVVKGESLQVGGATPVFQAASADGGRVFYTENGHLLVCEVGEDSEGHLACVTSDLTPAGGVETGMIVGVSEDGTYAYYVANQVLFESHEEAGVWRSTRIAELSGEDEPDWANGGNNPSQLSARVSGNGQWVAFMSDRDLVGYSTIDAKSEHVDEELYVFDAATGQLSCASCEPTGARPTGVEYELEGKGMLEVAGHDMWKSDSWLAAGVPGFTLFEGAPGSGRYQPRYVLDDGRVFFDSDDGLVPQDVNGTWDVYEWEPEGVGGEGSVCGSGSGSGSVVYKPARGFDVEGVVGEEGAGCVGLISSGASVQESAFIDASESGGDVFFVTTARLAPQDFDTAYDMYDAHECTGVLPCAAGGVSSTVTCTTAEECRSLSSGGSSVFGVPSSATFNGTGDVGPAVAPRLTRAQLLAKALKACRKKTNRGKRVACERKARRAYGPVKAAKKSTRGKKSSRGKSSRGGSAGRGRGGRAGEGGGGR
jgi:hypothetical protein